MALAKIDVAGMQRLVNGLTSGIETLDSARSSLRTTLSHYNLATWDTQGLQTAADWAREALPDARRRLSKAQALEGSNPMWLTGTVQFDDVTDISSMAPDKAEQSGKEAAEALRDGGKPDDDLIAQIVEMQDDPYFAAGFAGALSADELADVVITMGYNRSYPDGYKTLEQVDEENAWYGVLLNGMSTTMATATRNSDDLALPADYARSWIETIEAEVPTSPYYDGGDGRVDRANALTVLLNEGRFGDTFLMGIAEDVYAYERKIGDERGKVWGPRGSDGISNGGVYDADGNRFTDPMVGIMSALGRSSEVAATFFNPDGGGSRATDRAEYLIRDRTWTADDFDAVAEALDSAATTYHRPDATSAQQTQSAWIAAATVHYLGTRDGGRHDRAIGDAGKDSLAHLLSSYISDLDRVAQGQNSTPPESGPGFGVNQSEFDTAPWLAGLPVGAEFYREDLNKVLGEVLTDDRAMQQLADATAHFNAARTAGAADRFNADPTAGFTGPMQSSGQLQGYVLGNLERASKAAGKEVDDRNKQFIAFASDVVGLVPTGGTVASFLADQAKSRGADWIEEQFTGNEAAAASAAEKDQEATKLDLQIAAAVALADSPHLPESVKTDENGQVYPWFRPGASVDDAITDPDTRDQFIDWMKNDAGAIAELIPDVSQAYDDGREFGR
jgi:hypothetical protein